LIAERKDLDAIIAAKRTADLDEAKSTTGATPPSFFKRGYASLMPGRAQTVSLRLSAFTSNAFM
jgi:hypothetical protein